MQCELSPENAHVLDRLLRTTKSEYITVDTTSTIQLVLFAPDASQYTSIILDPSFFQEFSPLDRPISILFQKLSKPGMQRLSIDQAGHSTTVEYIFKNTTYTKELYTRAIEPLDIDFRIATSVPINLAVVRNVLRGVRAKTLKFTLGSQLSIQYEGTRIQLALDHPMTHHVAFAVDAGVFRRAIMEAELLSDHALAFSEETDSPLNIIMRGPEIFMSTFISIEWL